MIAITPASFQAISSMDDMLNAIPYVVVKEYFFKNTASMMTSFLKKIMGSVQEAQGKVKQQEEQSEKDNGATLAEVSKVGSGLIAAVKERFSDVLLRTAVIDIPYLLYCGLRMKMYGNTYVFPYIVSNSTIINQASNASEWGNGEDGGGLMEALKGAV